MLSQEPCRGSEQSPHQTDEQNLRRCCLIYSPPPFEVGHTVLFFKPRHFCCHLINLRSVCHSILPTLYSLKFRAVFIIFRLSSFVIQKIPISLPVSRHAAYSCRTFGVASFQLPSMCGHTPCQLQPDRWLLKQPQHPLPHSSM